MPCSIGPCHSTTCYTLAVPRHQAATLSEPLSHSSDVSLSLSLSLSLLGRGAGCWLAAGRWVSAPRASAARTRRSGERRPTRHAYLVRLCPRRQVSDKRLQCHDPAPAAELSGRGGCGGGWECGRRREARRAGRRPRCGASMERGSRPVIQTRGEKRRVLRLLSTTLLPRCPLPPPTTHPAVHAALHAPAMQIRAEAAAPHVLYPPRTKRH